MWYPLLSPDSEEPVTLQAARYNLRIILEDDFVLRFRVHTRNPDGSSGAAVNLTGWSIESKLVRDGVPIATITAVIEDPVNGGCKLSIAKAITTTLGFKNSTWYMAFTNPAGEKNTYMAGDAYHIPRGAV